MKKVIVFLLFSIIVIAIIPVFLPKTIHQEAEYIYDAPPAQVYDYFNNLKKMSEWFRWDREGKDISQKFSSPAQGVDATYQWGEDKDNLDNKLIITDGKDRQFVGYSLVFKDYKGNTSEAIFQTLDDGKVKVIWTFDSAEFGYPYQIYNYIMSFQVKAHLTEGLQKLDSLLKKNKIISKVEEKHQVEQTTQPQKDLLGIVQTVSVNDEDEYKTALEESFAMVESYLLDTKGLSPDKLGDEVVYTVSKDADTFTFIAGFFLDKKVEPIEDMKLIQIPTSQVLTLKVGNTKAEIEKAYHSIETYAQENNLHLLKPNTWQLVQGDRTELFVPIEGK